MSYRRAGQISATECLFVWLGLLIWFGVLVVVVGMRVHGEAGWHGGSRWKGWGSGWQMPEATDYLRQFVIFLNVIFFLLEMLRAEWNLLNAPIRLKPFPIMPHIYIIYIYAY